MVYGIVYIGVNVDNVVWGIVYNIYIKVFCWLFFLNFYFYCVFNLLRLVVDKCLGLYKVLVVWNFGECIFVYDFLIGKWLWKLISFVFVL